MRYNLEPFMTSRNIYVYDIETIAGVFTYTAIDIDTEEVFKYVIHDEMNQFEELIKHLKSCKGLIGYNNLAFDYPIIHYILSRYFVLKDMKPSIIVSNIYAEAQKIISSKDRFNVIISEKYIKIPQLDLFKIWHYDNKAKSTSLKALQVSMNYPNVMEMPIHHNTKNISLDDINSILEYNLNDVLSTYNFYKKTVEYGKIDLRTSIRQKYGLKCANWNNGKIGEKLILKLYCDKTGLDPYEVSKRRTERPEIALKDCIPSLVSFKSENFNKLLEYFKNKTITNTKGSIKYRLIHKGIRYDYGTGGIHAAIDPGIYISDDKYIIKTCDVASLYPNLPISNNFYIEHLGPVFLEVYRDNIVNVRLAEKAKPKNEQDKAIVDGFKEAANIPYGKSNDVNSFLYDPLYTMKTTITGQLVISMLAERLSEIPDSQILMVNTDGLEIRIPRTQQDLYSKICKEWENLTKLILEYDDYEKMWIADINNYGCISFKGKIKSKGRFEVDKVIGGEPAYYKDNSFRIVPLALQEYFSKNIPVEETIKKHKDIYDFCGRQKFIGEDYGITESINGLDIKLTRQQKVTRYYISNKGSSFIKIYSDGSKELINKGYQVTIFNDFVNKSINDYDINYKFYINECYKEINLINSSQLSLNL